MAQTVSLTVNPVSLTAAPGAEVETQISIQHFGAVVDVFSISVNGVPESWISLSSDGASVFPGDTAQVVLRLSVPRSSEAVSKVYEVEVTVQAQKDLTDTGTATLQLYVSPFYGYSTDLHPQQTTGPVANHTLTITNAGNSELAFSFEGIDREGLCSFTFDPQTPVVSPGATTSVATRVRGKRPFQGASRTFDYTITATPQQGTAEPQELIGIMVAPARISRWLIVAALAAVVLLVVGIGGYQWYQLRNTLPVLETFEFAASPLLLAPGETRQLVVNAIGEDQQPHDYQISWSLQSTDSTNPAIQLVTAEGGQVSRLAKGQTSVSVFGSQQGTAEVIATWNQGGEGEMSDKVEVLVVQAVAPPECIDYDPQNLRVLASADGRVHLTDANNITILTLNANDDPIAVIALASAHSARCFIGSAIGASTELRTEPRLEFWKGPIGFNSDNRINTQCTAYDNSSTNLRSTMATVTTTAGDSLSFGIGSPEDVNLAGSWIRSHSQVCYLGGPDASGGYLTQYWK